MVLRHCSSLRSVTITTAERAGSLRSSSSNDDFVEDGEEMLSSPSKDMANGSSPESMRLVDSKSLVGSIQDSFSDRWRKRTAVLIGLLLFQSCSSFILAHFERGAIAKTLVGCLFPGRCWSQPVAMQVTRPPCS